MPDIFGFVMWSVGIFQKKKPKTSSDALRQWYDVMAGRKTCLPNLYLDTEEKILLVYFAG